MRSGSLERDLTFQFTLEPGAADMDIAHAAAAQLVRAEKEVERLDAEKEGDLAS